VIVRHLRRRNPATVAARPATSLETAPTQLPPELVALVGNPVDTLAAVAGKSATSAARSVILLVTVPKVADPTVVEVMEATKEVTEADMGVDVNKAVRLVIPAVDMDICHATVPKGRSATTVSSDNCHTDTGTDTPSQVARLVI